MPLRTTLAALCVLAGALTASAEDAAPRTVLERLIAHCREDAALSAEAREAALQKLSAGLSDEPQAATSMAAALALLSPEYAAGLQALSDEEFATARAKFQPLVESPNPFLAADARFLVARAPIWSICSISTGTTPSGRPTGGSSAVRLRQRCSTAHRRDAP
jgi:TolA-binding protein